MRRFAGRREGEENRTAKHARRGAEGSIYGRGFNSRRLHRIEIRTQRFNGEDADKRRVRDCPENCVNGHYVINPKTGVANEGEISS